MIREALKNGTEMGLRAKSYMEEGQLVPDEVVIGIIKERLQQDDCKKRLYPSTASPVRFLRPRLWTAWALSLTRSLTLRSPTRRSSSVCPDAVSAKNAALPIICFTRSRRRKGVCGKCGGTLVQRKDDHPDTVKERL